MPKHFIKLWKQTVWPQSLSNWTEIAEVTVVLHTSIGSGFYQGLDELDVSDNYTLVVGHMVATMPWGIRDANGQRLETYTMFTDTC